jgi:glutathione S-transferase
MAVSIELTKEYGYVVLTVVAYAFLNFWMSFQVVKARSKYVLPAPNHLPLRCSSPRQILLVLENLTRSFFCVVCSRYKVFYPTLYAIESENKNAKLFNCVQVRQTDYPVLADFLSVYCLGGKVG